MLYKDAYGKDIEPEWHQSFVVHCQDVNCDGMLLQSIYYHPMKCSNCGKFWMQLTSFVEVTELS
jgi:hypothetical protein